ncbi:Ig-like domain-containing protein [Neobacillus drentensis]|uniref:Ig-like domain-containing protein n=1 Tax=Neobacillus drentensis TaxID=220684 RepID=UPI002FFFA3A1
MRSKFRILLVIFLIGLLLPVNEGFAASKINPGKSTSYRHLLFSDLVYRNMDGCENRTVSVCADEVIAKRMKKEVEGYKTVKKYLQKQLSLPKNKRDGKPDSNDDASLLRKIKSTDTSINKSQEKLTQFNNWVIKKDLKRYSGKWKVIRVGGKSSSAFYGVAFQDPATKNVVISFRGSQETIDWVNDAQTIAKFIPSMEEKQVPDAAKFVKDVYTKTKGAKFTITGHSLGGFLAQRMVLEIQGNPGNYFYKKYNANFSDFLKNKFQYAETFNAPGFFSDNTAIGNFKKKLALLEGLSGGEIGKGLSNIFLGYSTGKYVKPIKGVKGVYYRVYDHTFKDEPIGNFGFQLGGAAYYENNYKNKFAAHGKANFYKVTLKAPPINSWDKKAPSTPKVKTVTDKSTYVKGTATKNTVITVWYIKKDKKGNDLWYKMVSGYADKNGNFSVKIKPQKAGRILYVTSQDKVVNLSPAAKVTIKKFYDPYEWAPGGKEKFENELVEMGIIDSIDTIVYYKDGVVNNQGIYEVWGVWNGEFRYLVYVNVKTGWFHG